MKSFKYLFIAAILASALTVTGVSAKRKMMPRVYMFGFCASFTDSTVYFTNVQAVDSAWMDTKTKFLLGRDNYSYQLRDYFTYNQNMPNRTCIVMFGEKKKDVEEKYMKLKKKYTIKAKDMYDVKYLSESDFKFKPINMYVEEEEKIESRLLNSDSD